MLIYNSFELLDCLFIPYQSKDRVDFETEIHFIMSLNTKIISFW